jgi:hypothetical protein
MQLPMPLPADSGPSDVIHVNAHAQIHLEGGARAVLIAGVPVFRFAAGDSAGESFARVLLASSGAATVTSVAKAFDCARLSVYRELTRFEEGGIEGLAHRKRGPKRASKLRDASERRLVALKRLGVPNTQIAQKLGVTESAVRAACKRLGLASTSTVTMPLPKEPAGGSDAAEAAGPSEMPLVAAETLTAAAEAHVPAPSDESISLEPGAQPPTASATPAPEVAAAPMSPSVSTTTSLVAATVPAVTAIHGTPEAWNRDGDRLLAALGLLEEAPPQFGPAKRVRGAGVLLAVPALSASGMLDVARDLYRSFGRAFYGVQTIFVAMALMALLRVRRPERLRHRSPIDLGRLLGLDRAPEVKTLRRRIAALAARGQSEELVRQLACRRASAIGDAVGFLYVDGHVRVYSGKHDIPKAHVTRMRLSMPATVDHWVNDRDGDPLLVVTATPTASTARELPGVLEEIRKVIGERRVTVVFDRGGWSPKLFAKMVQDGFDFATYRKGRIPKVRLSRFAEHVRAFDGREVRYQLAERELRLSGGVRAREVVRLSENREHQTSIVTSRRDLAAVEVAYRMFERWRQENFFKYMGSEFELDALVQYGVEPADGDRDVPNPARRAKEREIVTVRKEVAGLERVLGAAVATNEEAVRPTVRGFKIANGKTGKALREAHERLERLREEARSIPRRVTAAEAAGGEPVRLRTEAKRLTDAVKTVAYQAESALVRLLRPHHYRRIDDEGRKLIASAFELTGDFEVTSDELRVTLEPAASPNRTRAIAALCAELNQTETCYPGTTLRLHFAIQGG